MSSKKISVITVAVLVAVMVLTALSIGLTATNVSTLADAENTTSVWDGTVDTSWYTEGQTSYTLDSAAKLAGLASLVNGGTDLGTAEINLTVDVDLNNLPWTPIADQGVSINFTLRGNNHTIYRMHAEKAANEAASYGTGLFGWLGGRVSVYDLTFDDCYSYSGSNDGNMWGGAGILGGDMTTSGGIFQNITVRNSTAKAPGNVGAILGWGAATFNDCLVENCTVISTSSSNPEKLGGFVGESYTGAVFNRCGLIDTDLIVYSSEDRYSTIAGTCGYFIGSTCVETITTNDCYTNVISLTNEQHDSSNTATGVTKTVYLNGYGATYGGTFNENNTRWCIDSLSDGVDALTFNSSKNDGTITIFTEARPATLTVNFLSDVTVSTVTRNGADVTDYTVAGNVLQLPAAADASYDNYEIQCTVYGQAVTVVLHTAAAPMPNHTLWLGDQPITEGNLYLGIHDGIHYLRAVSDADLSWHFDALLAGDSLTVTIGETVYNLAADNTIALGKLTGRLDMVIHYTHNGVEMTENVGVVAGLEPIMENDTGAGVYWIPGDPDNNDNWTLDSTTFPGKNMVTSPINHPASMKSVQQLYVINTDYLAFEYSASSESASYDFLLIKNGSAEFKAGGNYSITSVTDLPFSFGSFRFADPSFNVVEISYQKDSSVDKGLDRGFIYNFSTDVQYTNVQFNFDDTLAEVTYWGASKDGTPTVLHNGDSVSVEKNLTVYFDIFPVTKPFSLDSTKEVRTIFETYYYRYGDHSQNVDNSDGKWDSGINAYETFATDTTIDVVMSEPIPNNSVATILSYVNGLELEPVTLANGETAAYNFEHTNSAIVSVPMLGYANEACGLYIDGTYVRDLFKDETNNKYFNNFDPIDADCNFSLVYRIDDPETGKANPAYRTYTIGSYTLDIQLDMPIESVINPDTLAPISFVNDAPYPFVISEVASQKGGPYAIQSGNGGKGSSVSYIAIPIVETGILSFEYKIGSEPSYDGLCFTTDASTIKYNMTSWISGEKATSTGVIDWTACQKAVTAGQTAYIVYRKDSSGDRNGDYAAIRNVAMYTGSAQVSFGASEGDAGVTAQTNGTAVANGESVPVGNTVTLTYSNSQYIFYGWKNMSTGAIESFSTTYSFVLTKGVTYQAVVADKANPFVVRSSTGFYRSLTEALAAETSGTLVLVGDTTVDSRVVIPAGVTLLIPYSATDTVGTAIGESGTGSARVSWTNPSKYLYRTLTLAAGGELVVDGTVVLGGVQHFPDQSGQGHTSGAYSQIVNNGAITINGTANIYGLITGSGRLTANNGSKVYEPFVVLNFSGGTNTSDLYGENQFPFVQFATVNIQCPQTVHYGAKVLGMTSLYFWGGVTTQDVVLVDNISGFGGSVGSLLWLAEGSYLQLTYNSKSVAQALGNITLTEYGLTTVEVYGNVTAGSFDLQGYGSEGKVLAIPYTYNFVLREGANVTMPAGYGYKIMPGAVVTIDNGATLTVNGTLYAYDGLIQSDKSSKWYPDAGVLGKYGFDKSGMLVNNGTLNINGAFAGIVQTSTKTGIVAVAAGANVGEQTITDGSTGGYTNNQTIFRMTGRVYGLNGYVNMTAGTTYRSFATNGFVLSTFTVDSAARCSALSVTLNQSMVGRYLPWNGTHYVADVTVSIGQAVANVSVNMGVADAYATTDAQGLATATALIDTDGTVTYYTMGWTHLTYTAPVALDAVTTLPNVIKSIALDKTLAGSVWMREYNADGTIKVDFNVVGAIVYYSADPTIFTAAVDEATVVGYVQQATVRNEQYNLQFTAELTVDTAQMAQYRVDVAAIAQADDLVAKATELWAQYREMRRPLDTQSLAFVEERLAQTNLYASTIVKSVAVAGVTYGDTTANATATYIDDTTGTVTTAYVSHADNGITYRYDGSYDNVTYTLQTVCTNVAQRAVTVTITPVSSVYGDAVATLAAACNELAYTDTLDGVVSLATTATQYSPVGSYDVIGTCINGNYSVTFQDGTGAYTVAQRTVSVAWSGNESVVYDGLTHLPVATLGNVVDGDDVTAVLTDAQRNVGDYTAAISALSGADADNYKVEDAGCAYSITPRAITISISSATSVYGNPLAAIKSALTDGTLGEGDTLDSVYSLYPDGDGHTGVYSILVRQNGNNYTITTTGGENAYTITARRITVTIDAKTSVYGDELQALTGVVTTGTLVDGDSVDDLYTLEKAGSNRVGTYTITGTNISSDYNISFVEAKYTITARPVVVTINAVSSVYGDPVASLSAGCDDLVEGDTIDSICRLSTTVTTNSAVGQYDVTATKTSSNYTITFQGGEGAYTVQPRTLTLTWSNLQFVYDGATHVPTVTLGNLVQGDRVTATLSDGARNAGTHTAEVVALGGVNGDSYRVENANVEYTISPRAITVTIANAHSVYGDDLAALTATLAAGSTLGDGDSESAVYTLSVQDVHNVGAYTIAGSCINDNYTITFQGGEGAYSVTPRPITVAIHNATSVYGDPDSALTADAEPVAGNVVYDDVLTSLYSLARAEGNVVGQYAINGIDTADNYDVTFVAGVYSITARPVDLTWSNTALTYNGTWQHPTAEVVGALAGDEVSVVIGGDGKDADDYTALATLTGADSANYSIQNEQMAFTIAPLAIELSVSDHRDIMASAQSVGNIEVQAPLAVDTLVYSFVVYDASGVPVATIDEQGRLSNMLSVGSYTLEATLANANYTATCIVRGNLNVVEDNDYYTVSVTFADAQGNTVDSYIYDGTAVSVLVTVTVTQTGETVTDGVTVAPQRVTDAGTHFVNVTIGDVEYVGCASISIAPKTVTLAADVAQFEYNGEVQAPQALVLGLVDGDDVTAVTAAATSRNAGDHRLAVVDLTGADSDNYALPTDAGVDYRIEARAITLTIKATGSVYGDPIVAPLAELTDGMLGVGDSLDGLYALSTDALHAGVYDVAGIGTNDNYDITFLGGEGAYTVTARAITLAINAAGSVYGEADGALTVDTNPVAGSLVAGDTLNGRYSLARATGANVGEYSIDGIDTDPDDDYAIDFVSAIYTIEARTVTLDWTVDVYVYDGQPHAPAVSIGNVLNGDDVQAVVLGQAIDAEMAQTAYAELTGADSDNYRLPADNAQAFVIEARSVALLWQVTSFVYDGEAHTPVVALDNVVDGDDVQAQVSADSGVAVGNEYRATVTALSGADRNNYRLPDVVDGTYAITARPIVIDIVPTGSVYGDDRAPLTATLAEGSVLGAGDNFADLYTLNATIGHAGRYDIVGEAIDANYAITFQGGTNAYTVTARPVTLAINAGGSVYGEADGVLSVADTLISGSLVGDDTLDGRYTLTRTAGKNVGIYDIMGTDSNADDDYDISFVDGVYTVTARTVVLAWTVEQYIYDGQSHVPQVAVSNTLEGDDVAVQVGGARVNAGNYTATATLTGADKGNYELPADSTMAFAIEKRLLTVTWSNTTFEYDGVSHTPQAVLGNVIENDVVNAQVSADRGANVSDDYNATVVALTGSNRNNYRLPDDASTKYSIVQRRIVLIINKASSVYGDKLATLSATLGTAVGAAPGDMLSSLYALSTDAQRVGQFDIVGTTLNDNYNIDFVGGTGAYTVTARPVTLGVDNVSAVYGEADSVLTVSGITEGSLAIGDSLADLYELTREDGNTVGSYAITGTDISADYDVSFTPATYTIVPRAITLSIGDVEQVYGNEATPFAIAVVQGSYAADDTANDVIAVQRTGGNTVGVYDVTAQVINDNYAVQLVYTRLTGSQYTITARPVTVTVANLEVENTATWIDVSALLDGAYTVNDGLLAGDDLHVVLNALFGNDEVLTEDNFSALFAGGAHTIVALYDNDNYDVTVLTGVLTVTLPNVSVSGIQTQYTYSGEPIYAFGLANIQGALESATENTFRADYYKDGDEQALSAMTDAGTYRMVIRIVNTEAYQWADDAVTEYTIVVNKKDVSDSISIVGLTPDKEYLVYRKGLSLIPTVSGYDVNIATTYTVDGQPVDELGELGQYTMTVTVESANYTGSLSVAFYLVENAYSKVSPLLTAAANIAVSQGVQRDRIVLNSADLLNALSDTDKWQIRDNDAWNEKVTAVQDAYDELTARVADKQQRINADLQAYEQDEDVDALASAVKVILAINEVEQSMIDEETWARYTTAVETWQTANQGFVGRMQQVQVLLGEYAASTDSEVKLTKLLAIRDIFVGLSQSEWDSVQNTPEYKDLLDEYETQWNSQLTQINTAWDVVERTYNSLIPALAVAIESMLVALAAALRKLLA